jgi:hypothetical protein
MFKNQQFYSSSVTVCEEMSKAGLILAMAREHAIEDDCSSLYFHPVLLFSDAENIID